MAKITQEQKAQMVDLYKQLKTYSAVAKKMGISVATATKYIKEANLIRQYNTCKAAKSIDEIPTSQIVSFSFLTDEEIQSCENWEKEFM